MKLNRENVFPWDNKITDVLYEMEGSEDYLRGCQDFLDILREKQLLPSKYQLGDSVVINFGESGLISNCKVIKVHFTYGKTLYDVAIHDGDSIVTRLYNIDSVFVTKQ